MLIEADIRAHVVAIVISAIRLIKDAADLPAEIDESTALYPLSESEVDTLELDSLDALDLITELERVFATDVYEEVDPSQIRTVGDVADFILKALADAGVDSETLSSYLHDSERT